MADVIYKFLLLILFVTSVSVVKTQKRQEHASINSTQTIISTTTELESSTFSSSPSSIAAIDDDDDCYILNGNMDDLSQDKFVTHLTHACRYDKLVKPKTKEALNVSVQIDLRHVEAFEHLQYKSHMLVQYRYVDHRLMFEHLSPTRGMILGEEPLRDKIWVPHIVLDNERENEIMGIEGKDVFVSISPNGEVVFSYRMTATIYCWMNLQKFPFDTQTCSMKLKSWTYNASNLLLIWENKNPVKVSSQLHLTEFSLNSYWTYSQLVGASLPRSVFVGNFSVIVFKFQLDREIGYYLLDYFLPSIMIVCTSWVTFWLHPDASAPRAIIGTSTMLTFITLSTNLSKNLPKVSYIKASEIWFIGITIFIFASMSEFALVNMVWHRRKQVELKKNKSKYILKSAITPKLAKKQMQRCGSTSHLYKTRTNCNEARGYDNYLTVHSFPSNSGSPCGYNERFDTNDDMNAVMETVPEQKQMENEKVKTWTTMTPQEISIWIDKKSRIVFPIAFIIYNILYWSFVYALWTSEGSMA